MTTLKHNKKGWTVVEVKEGKRNLPAMRLALAAFRTKTLQLQNDLGAAKAHMRSLSESNDNLRRDHALQSKALHDALRERDDWRDAFKLIMRLVK